MIKCYLIDDDIDDHEIFDLALNNLNLNVECRFATNGKAGMELLKADQTFTPDIIFLDLNMPVMGGKEFLSLIKQSEFKNIPVFIYSTSDEEVFRKETAALGAAGYIVKTSTLSALKDILKSTFHPFV